jgi:methylenetetrahydrofolate reductase (NADPH)
MRVPEHIEIAKKLGRPQFSFEIVPPPRGRSIQDIIEIATKLEPVEPRWIDVTAHASEATYNEKADGSIERKVYRRRPGTMGICGVIQNRFKIDTVAHLLCQGFTKEETEDALIELHYTGVHNVLALRGDGPNYKKEVNKSRGINQFASDLVGQIVDLRKGHFVNAVDEGGALDFCVGVAGYPEKHFEAANLKTDILNLKKKVDAGGEYVMTQMFYDTQKFFEFEQQCRDAGITVPIIPGLKIIKSKNQLVSIAKNFYVDFPEELVSQIELNPDKVPAVGIEWAKKQTQELISAGYPVVHFYIMNDTDNVLQVVKTFKK